MIESSQALATQRKFPTSESQYAIGVKKRGAESTKLDVKKALFREFKRLGFLFSPSVEMKVWAVAERSLNTNASLLGMHDLGFMICPWTRLQWDLDHNEKAFDTLLTAANTLADRFCESVGCIRSWHVCQTKIYSFEDPDKDFLVIIDNMMNLDLLFWAASQTSSQVDSTRLFDIAMAHSQNSQNHSSCWSRGQAWAIGGFAKSYEWSGESSFLNTAKNCADYFLKRLPDTHIPPWDFDAQESSGTTAHPPDTSAAMVAAYGMLLIHQSLQNRYEASPYLDHALRIVDAVCERHLDPEAVQKQRLGTIPTVENGRVALVKGVESAVGDGDTILNGTTINNFEFAPRRWADHGLVYADYFFVLFGNKLLEMNALRRAMVILQLTTTKEAQVQHSDTITPAERTDDYGQKAADLETSNYAQDAPVYIDEKTNKELFWTVNKRILACMLGTYFCQSLDKGTLGFSSVMNIREDANLHGQQFSWLGTILYMGVLVGEYPTNFLLQKLPVGKYLSTNVFSWGVVIACSAAAKDFAGLMVVRFLLGLFASCVQPAFIIMTSMWYTKREQSILTSIWYCMTGIQLMAKGFNEDQKRLMVERVRANETGIQNKSYKRYQAIEAVTDPIVCPSVIGTAIIYSIPPTPSNRVELLVAFYCTQFYLAEGNLIFSLISRNIAGQTKKSTTLAITFVAWAAGNMTAPQIFQKSDSPRYKNDFTAHFCLYVLFNIFLVILRLLLVRRNAKKRNATLDTSHVGDDSQKHSGSDQVEHLNAFADLKDRENPDFRYDF
ncbi:Unsaturated glucuronyl hydrolase [Fusarium beomiforme]|uniref:Unsaturated glucuronyl hydrolase n=1 Tax=Fusarium beomiforme TaxID=44412 RepID=A0A9P5E1L0_9HYPO|nr:Unsaturated glucuronyl hydrolase [Fusarium beomiforme]